ncbi:MAG: hypothetical protein IJD70_03145 [Clostridia bacterium]|nr:hypothetical protein [Clostridia bacterium]
MNKIKNYFFFYFELVLVHLISALVYGILLSNMAGTAANQKDFSTARGIIGVFAIVIFVIFNAYLVVEFARNGEKRRVFLTETKGKNLGLVDFCKVNLRETLIFAAIYTLGQLPYCLLYSKWGYSHDETMPIEYPFVMDAGIYELIGSEYLGMILTGVLFFAIQLIGKTYVLLTWDKERIER